jgi:hypothetical protein
MSQRVLRRNLGFMAGLLALSVVAGCSDDTSASPAVGGDASREATAVVDSSSTPDVTTVVDSSTPDVTTVVDSSSTPDVTAVVDSSTPDVTSGADAAAPDSGMEAATGGDGGDGGGSTVDAAGDVAASDASDAALGPFLQCAFGSPDASALCLPVTDGGTGWQLKFAENTLPDGGTGTAIAAAGLTLVPATDAGPGGLEWTVPFTGQGQTSQIVLWISLPGFNVGTLADKVLTFTVQGLIPVTSDPANPGYWDMRFQSEDQADGGGANTWPWSQYIVSFWTTTPYPNGTLAIPDGGAAAWQTVSIPLGGFSDPGLDTSQIVSVFFDISTPLWTATVADAATYSTANIIFSNFAIE